jgi:hypothetical protein
MGELDGINLVMFWRLYSEPFFLPTEIERPSRFIEVAAPLGSRDPDTTLYISLIEVRFLFLILEI